MFRSGHKPPAFSSFSASAAMTRTGHPARLLCDVEAWSQTADVRSFQSSTFDVEQQSPSAALRSEEQTSELQSLMRISYAVFCLQKKHYTSESTTHIVVIN